MRVTYNREMLMKSHFDGLGIECFVPMSVVVRIQGVAAVVIANMPSRFVEEIV